MKKLMRFAVILALAAVGMGAYSLFAFGTFDPLWPLHNQAQYNYDNLRSQDGRLAYTKNGQQVSLTGVDVSAYQGSIDWSSVAADGVSFAIVRVGYRGYTEGALHEDVCYRSNLRNAQAAGLHVGAYFFSQAITEGEAAEEAAFTLQLLRDFELDLPVCYDHELVSYENGRANDVDSTVLDACARVFCETLEAAGYSTMIYGSLKDLARYSSATLNEHSVWVAQHDVSHPTTDIRFDLWQYTSNGEVAGIYTRVDMNILMNAEEFAKTLAKS